MGTGWLAHATTLRQGYMEHKVIEGERDDGSRWASTQPRVTAKGMTRLAMLLGVSLQGEALAA